MALHRTSQPPTPCTHPVIDGTRTCYCHWAPARRRGNSPYPTTSAQEAEDAYNEFFGTTGMTPHNQEDQRESQDP